MKKFELGIVVPTYNEKDNIRDLLPLIKDECVKHQIKTQVLVMDDNSPDGTGEEVRKLAESLNTKDFQIKLNIRPGKMGLASAYIQGFEMIKDEVEFLLSMDADLSHKPEYIHTFIENGRKSFDFVIGSRNIAEGGVENWAFYRKLLSKFGSVYAKSILNTDINDFTGGFNLYRASVFDQFPLYRVKAQGYLFQIEMKYSLAQMGFKYTEFPIIFPDRTKGKSKISKKIIIEAFTGVWKLKKKKFTAE